MGQEYEFFKQNPRLFEKVQQMNGRYRDFVKDTL